MLHLAKIETQNLSPSDTMFCCACCVPTAIKQSNPMPPPRHNNPIENKYKKQLTKCALCEKLIV